MHLEKLDFEATESNIFKNNKKSILTQILSLTVQFTAMMLFTIFIIAFIHGVAEFTDYLKYSWLRY